MTLHARRRLARLRGLLAPVVGLCALAVAPPATAREPLETIVQDDALLLHRSDEDVAAAMRRLRGLGVDRVRLTAGWSVIAPDPDALLRPVFDAVDPNAYPGANWRNLDRAVRLANEAGLEVMIDIAFWAPAWATSDAPAEGRARENIDPAAYAAFASAVVTRYSGSFTPGPDGGEPAPPSKDRTLLESLLGALPGQSPRAAASKAQRPLPEVRWWTIWNEPNIDDFFRPQYERTAAGLRPLAPHLYRAMVEAAYPAIKAIQPDSTVLIGGTAAIGARTATSESSAIPPLRFLRELACVDDGLRPIASGRCAGFERLPGDGFAHHPYSLRNRPEFRDERNPDRVPIGALDRLTTILDRLAAAGRIAPGLADVYLTEFGYATNPPDPRARFGLAQQARLLNRAERMAWSNPRVRSWPQFLLRDSTDRGLYQTGLLFADGLPKPALRSFELPLVADCVVPGTRSGSRRKRRGSRGRRRASRQERRGSRRRAGRPGQAPRARRARRPGPSRRGGRRGARRRGKRARRAARPREVVIWGRVRSPGAARHVSLSVLRRGRWAPLASKTERRRRRRGARASTRPFATTAGGVFVRRVPFRRGARYRAEAVVADGSVRQSLDIAPGGCRKPAI